MKFALPRCLLIILVVGLPQIAKAQYDSMGAPLVKPDHDLKSDSISTSEDITQMKYYNGWVVIEKGGYADKQGHPEMGIVMIRKDDGTIPYPFNLRTAYVGKDFYDALTPNQAVIIGIMAGRRPLVANTDPTGGLRWKYGIGTFDPIDN